MMKAFFRWTLAAVLFVVLYAAFQMYREVKQDCTKDPYVSNRFCD